MYYIYVLRCSDGTLYTGYTNNLENRLELHNKGKGAKYTRGRTPVELIYFEEFEDIANFVYKNAKDGDLVLTMGAGDIYKVGELILDMDVSRIEAIRKTKIREIQKIED